MNLNYYFHATSIEDSLQSHMTKCQHSESTEKLYNYLKKKRSKNICLLLKLSECSDRKQSIQADRKAIADGLSLPRAPCTASRLAWRSPLLLTRSAYLQMEHSTQGFFFSSEVISTSSSSPSLIQPFCSSTATLAEWLARRVASVKLHLRRRSLWLYTRFTIMIHSRAIFGEGLRIRGRDFFLNICHRWNRTEKKVNSIGIMNKKLMWVFLSVNMSINNSWWKDWKKETAFGVKCASFVVRQNWLKVSLVRKKKACVTISTVHPVPNKSRNTINKLFPKFQKSSLQHNII